jgi:hypothetical protein
MDDDFNPADPIKHAGLGSQILHQQFSFWEKNPCGSGFQGAKSRGKMPLTQHFDSSYAS